jgi:hypothetical protein
MWSRAARNLVIGRVLTTALTLAVCGGVVDWGHIGGDDVDCNVLLVHHDHAAHRLAPASAHSSPTSEHCYLCHSLRGLHTALAHSGEQAVLSVQSTPLCQVDGAAIFSVCGVSLSTRAPPTASL